MSSAAESSPPLAPRGWWGRHWKWAVPLLVLLIVVAAGLVWAWPIVSLRFHPQYVASLEEICSSPEVVERIGEPIKTARPFPGGSVTTDGNRGEASFYFDVDGPKGTAAVSSKSRLLQGEWGFTQLELTFADNKRIDLANGIQQRDGDDDMPKFDPNAKQPEVNLPDLPKDIVIPDVLPGPGQ